MKRFLVLGVLITVGCSTNVQNDYRPVGSREKRAFSGADRNISLSDVKKDFNVFLGKELVWAGIIQEIQFKETERTIQVAFEVDHREFDWKDYGGSRPYQLSEAGDGAFIAGWVVNKPSRISYLKSLAKPGDMILVYGKPYRMSDGVVQLAATAVQPVKNGDIEIIPSKE